jgi:transglutaminase-like putative cysteine protease
MMGTTVVMTLTANDPRRKGPASDGVGPQGAELPELLIQNFVRPSHPLDSPRSLRRAVYRLRADGVDLKPMVPAEGVQTARPESDSMRVTIDLDAAESTAEATVEATVEPTADYLESNRFVDFDSESVQALIRTWRTDQDTADPALDAAAKAESLRRLVGGHLSDKNLGTILGSASEAATSGAGDCTEHAVLLAALLRAETIPSRVAVGLVYAEDFAGERDIFAYHMWTQALLDPGGRERWVDLDATLPGTTPFDATHILFATSSLAGDGVPLIGTGVEAIFGLLSIEVVVTGADADI